MSGRFVVGCFLFGHGGVPSSLPGVALFEPFGQPGGKYVVFEAPVGGNQQLGGRLRDESLYDDLRPQPFDEIDAELDVLVGGAELELFRVLGVLGSHPCATDQLELVQFQRGKGQLRQPPGVFQQGRAALSRQSQYQVPSGQDSAPGGTGYGRYGIFVRMSPVDLSQGLVVGRFDAVFNQNEGRFRERGQVVEQLLGHTVGACADDNPLYAGDGEGLFVFLNQPGRLSVGVCVRLEIGQVLHLRVFAAEKPDTLGNLLGDALVALAVVGAERLVVAVGASAVPFAAVAVGTGEAGVDRDFLDLPLEVLFQKIAEVVVSCHVFSSRWLPGGVVSESFVKFGHYFDALEEELFRKVFVGRMGGVRFKSQSHQDALDT